MIGQRTEDYIDGLLAMASAAAGGIGCSAIAGAYFPREGFAREFARRYGLAEPRLVPVQKTLAEVLCLWLGGWEEASPRDRRLAEDLAWLLRRRLGEPEALFDTGEDRTPVEALGWGDGGAGPFYMAEELLFVRYPAGTLCLILGNDE